MAGRRLSNTISDPHFGALTEATRTLSSRSRGSLWHPSLGIRFSPDQSRRFVHQTSFADELAADDVGHDQASGKDAALPLVHEVAAVSLSDTLEDGAQPVQSEPAGRSPSTPDFTMSQSLFEAAKAAAPGTAESYWSYKLYKRTEQNGDLESVKVHYCENLEEMEEICRRHFRGHDVLGFDLEWCTNSTSSSGTRHYTSVVQLAAPGVIGVFHLARFPGNDFVAPTFREIMTDAAVWKVGVNITGDRTRLENSVGISARSIFELSHMYKLVKYVPTGRTSAINRRAVTLATQVEEHLGLPLCKESRVRVSNWMAELSKDQIEYAASDAYACLQLFSVLDAKRKELQPCPPRPRAAELGLPIRVTEDPIKKPPATREAPPVPREPNTFPLDYYIEAAECFVHRFRLLQRTWRPIPPSALRTFYIWHEYKLDPEALAAVLRTPPLKMSTVTGYIMTCIQDGNLDYDRKRLRTEVLPLMHPAIVWSKYKKIARRCKFEDESRRLWKESDRASSTVESRDEKSSDEDESLTPPLDENDSRPAVELVDSAGEALPVSVGAPPT
ncbi:hypothetical protein GQ602_000609 [Ophiocordyceps camponoti-floridani]|uniref:3'-5' exonuclease domain-containing protein n=1 Tax=Ophiocordyceps camponoti-floridani TaxID=2030778 RepID=A0A8H4QCG5_9HYPO|nr:hypothetical protein GQ602_000609 [Ophiocordyceps camponoti-floridani]